MIDADKVIDNLSTAIDSLKSTAVIIKDIKQEIAGSNIKAYKTILPKLDTLISSFKSLANDDTNSILEIINILDATPFADLREVDSEDEDIFEDEANVVDGFDVPPETYLDNDDLNDLNNETIDSATQNISAPGSSILKQQQEANNRKILNRFLGNTPKKYSENLNFDELDEMVLDNEAYCNNNTPLYDNHKMVENLIDKVNATPFSSLRKQNAWSMDDIEKMNESMESQGVDVKSINSDAYFRESIIRGNLREAGDYALNRNIAPKMQESSNWEDALNSSFASTGVGDTTALDC